MPFFIFSLLFFLISSCSLKHDSSKIPLDLDSDGDKIFDWKENERGTNPLIADLPDLRVRFLQNFSITVSYLEGDKEKYFKIDTKTARNRPIFNIG
ncbi:MAG: hypothetical protein OXB88_08475 [Bacteriovoracales bacterium]|nr:hypothetical protein [Bacteriovoracales bacterium]